MVNHGNLIAFGHNEFLTYSHFGDLRFFYVTVLSQRECSQHYQLRMNARLGISCRIRPYVMMAQTHYAIALVGWRLGHWMSSNRSTFCDILVIETGEFVVD